jgi:Tfp pilus assembly protein PilE
MLKKIKILKSQNGLTLMEVILMLVILGVVALPLAKLSITNLRSQAGYQVMTRAIYDARSVMEQILAYYSSNTYAQTRTNWANKSGQTNSKQFNYLVTVSNESSQNGIFYSEITVTVSGGSLKQNVILKSWITR